MKNRNLSNLFAYSSLTSGSIWLGSYITRLLLTYNLFEEGELSVKSFVSSSNASGIIEALSPLVYFTSITFMAFIISFTFYLFTSKTKLKENGWLFIIVVIVYLTLPFELFLLTIDYKLIVLYSSNNFEFNTSLNLIIDYMQAMGSFPIILILSYLSIPFFLVFRPFSRDKQL